MLNITSWTHSSRRREKYQKFNFSEMFNHPPFVAMSPVIKLIRKKIVKDRRTGEPKYRDEIREQGWANLNWLNEHKLTNQSSPSDWFSALLPDKHRPTDPRSTVTIADWTTYTNTRALLSNAGQQGHLYPEFQPFSPADIKQFVTLYILQGLSPSPQIKMKFQPQHEDPVNGNDMCHKIFGKNAEKKHKHFKTFFTIQDPLKPIPPKLTHPNFRVDSFLAWIQWNSWVPK